MKKITTSLPKPVKEHDMAKDKISIKLLKKEKQSLKSELDSLTGKETELQNQIDVNRIRITNFKAEITQIGADIDTLKG